MSESSIPPKEPPQAVFQDETETKLGITAYMTPGTGFSAVLKARFSDFLVHEVDGNGSIVRLTNRDVPKSCEDNEEERREEEKKKEEEANMSSSQPVKKKWSDLESELNEMIKDPEISKKVVAMLQYHNTDDSSSTKRTVDGEPKAPESQSQLQFEQYVTLPALEKAQRTGIHNWVRKFVECARTDSLDGRIRIWHVRFETKMPNYKKFAPTGRHKVKRSKKSWPVNRPPFLQFVLYKENMDTTTACKELSRKSGKARIGYAGMKDKRGITTQLCTLFKTEPQQILSAVGGGGGNTKQRGYAVVQTGNFQYTCNEIRLGSLQGNRFDVALRNVQLDGLDEDIEDAEGRNHRKIEFLKQAATAMKQKGFVNYFGTQRFGKYKDTHLVGIAVLQGDFRRAIDTIMAPKKDDRPDAAKARHDWVTRFVNDDNEKSNDGRKESITAEKEVACCKRIMKSLNRFMTAENSIVQSLLRKPLDYKRAFTCIPKTLRMMFLHAVQSLIWNRAASHRILSMNNNENAMVGDLVLQETSVKDDGKKNGAAKKHQKEVRSVTEDDVATKRYTLEDVVVPLLGTKSQLPTNELGDLMKKLLQEIGVSLEMFKTVGDKDLNIYGDYRKLIVRPNDFDFEIKEYYDPLQPLLQTDLMKLDAETIAITPKKEEENEKQKLAMVVGFTLPPSSYATIALRELMKRPTSIEYQKDLPLS